MSTAVTLFALLGLVTYIVVGAMLALTIALQGWGRSWIGAMLLLWPVFVFGLAVIFGGLTALAVLIRAARPKR